MSEDLTKKLPPNDSEKLTLILSIVQKLALDAPTRADLDTRIRSLEQKVEERLYDTRPIWEKAVADIAQLQQGQEALRTDVRALRQDMYYRFGDLKNTLMEIQVDHRDVHDRVSRLELNQNPPNSQA